MQMTLNTNENQHINSVTLTSLANKITQQTGEHTSIAVCQDAVHGTVSPHKEQMHMAFLQVEFRRNFLQYGQ